MIEIKLVFCSHGYHARKVVLIYASSIHLCVTMPVTQSGVADQFIKDVEEGAEKILKNPKKKTTGGVKYKPKNIIASLFSAIRTTATFRVKVFRSKVCKWHWSVLLSELSIGMYSKTAVLAKFAAQTIVNETLLMRLACKTFTTTARFLREATA